MGRIIKLSKNPHIIYELVPELSVIFMNQPMTTNANGFRGEFISVGEHPQTIRIVGIGDSVMFGWGVKDEETYLAILSEMLHLRYSECTWEIINTAVPGYNTVMEVETLKEKGLPYRPDIVIINFVGNDLDLPNMIRDQEDYFAYNQSFIVKYVTRSLSRVKMIGAPQSLGGGRFEANPQKVPKQYQSMVGLKAYHKAMKELRVLSHHHQFDVVVLSHAYLPDFVKKISSELGFHIVETAPIWNQYAAEHHLDAARDWPLNEKDPHPSLIGHEVIAKALFKFLEERQFACQANR